MTRTFFKRLTVLYNEGRYHKWTGRIRLVLQATSPMKNGTRCSRWLDPTRIRPHCPPPPTLQELLGHTHLNTTGIYTHLNIQKLIEVHRLAHPAKLPDRTPPGAAAAACQTPAICDTIGP